MPHSKTFNQFFVIALLLFIYPFWDGIAPWNSHVEFFTLVVHSSSESTSLYSKALLCILATTAIPATWFSLWYPRIFSLLLSNLPPKVGTMKQKFFWNRIWISIWLHEIILTTYFVNLSPRIKLVLKYKSIEYNITISERFFQLCTYLYALFSG